LPRDVVEANGGGDASPSLRDRRADAAASAGDATALGALVVSGASAVASSVGLRAARVAVGASRRVPTSPARLKDSEDSSRRDPADPSVLARHRAELHRAVATLHRAVGVTCIEFSNLLGVSAPEHWGPFASLAFYAAEAGRRHARDGDPGSVWNPDARRVGSRNVRGESEDDATSTGSLMRQMRRSFTASFFVNRSFETKRRIVSSGVSSRAARPDSPPPPMGSGRGRGSGREEEDSLDFPPRAFAADWASAASFAELTEDGWDLVDDARGAGRRGEASGASADISSGARPCARREARAFAGTLSRSAVSKSLVAVPTVLPPPPSRPEDVEHWTRAMYVDARR
jgi:hypothetical protein